MIEYLGQILYKLYPALTKSQWTHNVTLTDTILAYNLIFRPVDRTSNAQHATGQMNNFASTSLKRHEVSTTLVIRCLKVANPLGNTQYTNGSKVQQRRGHMKLYNVISTTLHRQLRVRWNIHYENKPIQIYWKIYLQKKWKFSDKNSDFFFHISAQNIDCGYSLEPPHRGGSNEYPQSMFFEQK